MVAPIWNRYIEEASQRYNVPPALISSVIGAESSGQPGAVSRAGAGGLMQLMPDTFADLQKTYNLGPDRMNPQTNIQAGTAYLGQLYKQFGSWSDALSAYNAGPNRWRQVQAGTREAPQETTDYTKKVLASFGQPAPQTPQEAGVPLFSGQRVGSLTGLLDIDQDKNFYNGLGNLLNFGQTESQPPRIDPAAMPGTTQTDRLDVSGKINELIQQYLQKPQAAGPSQLQYALAGAQKGMAGLSGVHDRKVGIGEMLGALGGGVTSGGLAYDEAQQQRQGGDLAKLLQVGSYQNQNRTAELNEANSIIDNRLKDAQTQKALRAETDPKVVGKWIYEGGQWKAPPGGAADGAFEGNAADVQAINELIRTGKITKEQGALWLASKTATGPNGQVDVINPLAIPGGGTPPVPAPNAAAPGQSAAPPAAATTPGVTTVRPPEALPQGEATKLRGQIDTLNKLKGAVAALGNNVEKTGMNIGGVGALSATQGSLYEDLQTQLRLANELGVLNGPDERKLLEQISNPTALSTYIRGLGGPSYFNAQMKVLQDKIDRETAQYEGRLGIKKPEGGGSGGGGGPTTVLKLDSQGNIIK